ncbi:MAG: type I restriction endonuclease subunit R [Caulobacteraceae bacterium]
MRTINESHVEDATLTWLEDIGYSTIFGPEIIPDVTKEYRTDYSQVVIQKFLKRTLTRLNPKAPEEAIESAIRKLLHPGSPSLVVNNHTIHRMLVDGVEVEYRRKDGSIKGDRIKVLDFTDPDNNEWHAINQFTVIENRINRRPDVVLFVNGLPLCVIELKNPADEKTTLFNAYNQLQTYKREIPTLFNYNELLIISDGLDARVGSLTAEMDRFMPWRTMDKDKKADKSSVPLEVLIRGICDKRRLLDFIRYFIVFEDAGTGSYNKIIAGYHQYYAALKAVESTIEASGPDGDRRCGVVWHTQGSGKSLTMAFYAGAIVLHPIMENPTIVVLTDRNDLDDQLFNTFSRCHELLRQTPVQAQDREELRGLLSVASGGVIFTTIQKFFPEKKGLKYPALSDRHNIVVIADEAHRSQYDFIDGYARHIRDALPNASFIGFTGTPIELQDKSTRQIFGDYISIYDIQQAVEDKATVPILYESRLAKILLDENERPHIDDNFEEVTEAEEAEYKERLKSKWAALEAVVGTEKRIKLIAQDIVDHFEKRQEAIDGKAMVVCMSRRICIELYEAIKQIKPEWHSDDDTKGEIKVVMTGSASDPAEWQPHIRNKQGRELIAKRFKDPEDTLKMAIVRDMWLTGFDVPSMHTMYIDKPMRGHTLMQAIARVNRVFKDKPGGLIVDYIGLGPDLKNAIAVYTENGGKGDTVVDQEAAVAVMMEKYEICCGIFHGFDWSSWEDPAQQLKLINQAQDFILEKRDGKDRFLKAESALSKAFALAVPHVEALKIRDDVTFFQATRTALVKTTGSADHSKKPWEMEHAIRQIISNAIVTDEVIDVFSATGLKKPDISILSEEFLAEVKNMPHKNLAVELLRKLLEDEIKTRSRKRLVQSRSFADMLDQTIKKYKNRTIETVEVIEELIKLAKELREADKQGVDLGLTEEEIAFYEALEVNDSAVKVLGDEVLRKIAQELANTIRQNVTIDWTIRESVRAKMRVLIKRILRKYGYPPDKQEKAIKTVLDQAELICGEIAY